MSTLNISNLDPACRITRSGASTASGRLPTTSPAGCAAAASSSSTHELLEPSPTTSYASSISAGRLAASATGPADVPMNPMNSMASTVAGVPAPAPFAMDPWAYIVAAEERYRQAQNAALAAAEERHRQAQIDLMERMHVMMQQQQENLISTLLANPRFSCQRSRSNTPGSERWGDADDDDESAERGGNNRVNTKEFVPFEGKSRDDVEEWLLRVAVLQNVHGYTDLAMKRAFPILIKDSSPAHTWFPQLNPDNVAGYQWPDWVNRLREEFGDLNRNSVKRADYANCTPESGKFKTFPDFIDEKLRLRSQAYGADANTIVPISSTLDNFLGFLPPDIEALARTSNCNTPHELKQWLRKYFSSPRTADGDPCAIAYKKAKNPPVELRSSSDLANECARRGVLGLPLDGESRVCRFLQSMRQPQVRFPQGTPPSEGDGVHRPDLVRIQV